MTHLYTEMNNIVKAIDELDLNDWILNLPHNKSFIFNQDPQFMQIKNHHSVLQDYHSSASFAKAFKQAHLFYFRL